jgi:hypothetical protein
LTVQELAVFKDGAAKFQGSDSSSSKQVEGNTSDLTGARLVTTMIVNGVPRTAIEVVEGVRKFRYCPHATDMSSCCWLVVFLMS